MPKTKKRNRKVSALLSRPVSISNKIAVITLVITLFANSVFAAPDATRTVVVTADQIAQDIRFNYSSTNFGTTFSGWANGLLLFLTRKQQTSELSRIDILPGRDHIIVRQGEPINFMAFGFTANGRRVGGLRFDWTVADTGRGHGARNLPDGIFHAPLPGNFIVKASTGSFQAQINVTVEENRPLMMLKRLKEQEAIGDLSLINILKLQNRYSSVEISSKKANTNILNPDVAVPQETIPPGAVAKSMTHGPNAVDTEPEHNNPAVNSKSRMMMRPALDDGWDNSNWRMADDPDNRHGNPPGSSPDAGAGNGNFQFSAPVVSMPGRGIDLSLSLNYNSRVWSKAGNLMSFDAERGSPAPGWNLGFGKMMFMGTDGGCMMIDADGTNHGYTGTVSNYSNGTYSSTNFTGRTRDGTFIDYSCFVSTYSGVTSMSGSSSLPNGTKVSYNTYSANGKQAFPTQIADAQGNYINISYLNNRGPSIQTVTDTLGRVVTFNYDSLSRLISVDVPKMNNAGTRTAVRLHYKQITLNAGWSYPVTGDTNNAYPYVVDAIYYPGTNTGYWFNDGDSYSSVWDDRQSHRTTRYELVGNGGRSRHCYSRNRRIQAGGI